MNASWSSPATLAGILAAASFAGLCYSRMKWALIVFTALGCIVGLQVGAFAGSEMVQGLLPVEVLASVLIAVWGVKGLVQPRRLRRTPFNLPLLLLIPSAVVSLLVGFTWFDPNVAVEHMKVTVSMGQILLLIWPIGIYLVVANSVNDDDTIDAIVKIIKLLALPSLGLIVFPNGGWPYLGWSTAFALPAASLCFAEFFYTRSIPRQIFLLTISIAPAIYGFEMGKALFYVYVAVSMATITWFKAPRLALTLAPPVLGVYILLMPIVSDSFTPRFLQEAVETEEQQQSIGGRGGRDQLVIDGLAIWWHSPVPLFGVGPANNYPYMIRYQGLGTAHNQYVNIIIEQGIVGLLCFLGFAYQAMRMGLALRRSVIQRQHQILVVGWLGVFAAMLFAGLLGDFMLPSIRNGGLELLSLFYVQWILLGLVVSVRAFERDDVAVW